MADILTAEQQAFKKPPAVPEVMVPLGNKYELKNWELDVPETISPLKNKRTEWSWFMI